MLFENLDNNTKKKRGEATNNKNKNSPLHKGKTHRRQHSTRKKKEKKKENIKAQTSQNTRKPHKATST